MKQIVAVAIIGLIILLGVYLIVFVWGIGEGHSEGIG